jgi:hypothetical protein
MRQLWSFVGQKKNREILAWIAGIARQSGLGVRGDQDGDWLSRRP